MKEVRIMGGCICLEVKDAGTLEGFREFAYERGVFSRPFGRCMYAMVPYIIREDELRHILKTMKDFYKK